MTASPEATRDFMERTGARAVPVLDIGGELVVGWHRNKVQSLLGLA